MALKQWIQRRWFQGVLLCSLPWLAWAGTLEKAIDTQVKTDVAAQQSQQKIDNLTDETAQMLAEYRDILRQTASLHAYNEQLNKLVTSQKKELDSIAVQLKNIETTQRDIVPLMLKMVETLAMFVKLDVPFLPDERSKRIQQLQVMMSQADVTLAEKYRRILEAYQVEMEYGRTIEAYKGKLQQPGTDKIVNFLRIGRVALYYLTLDGKEAGVWFNRKWQSLDDRYRQAIAQGLKVAKKQLPPDLLVLPVKTAEVAQ